MSLRVIWQYMDRSVTKNILYGSRHQQKYYMDLRSFGPNKKNFCDEPVHMLPYDPQCHELFVIYTCRHISIISNDIEIKKKIDVSLLVCLFVFLSIIFLTNRERNVSACFFKLFLSTHSVK